MSAEAAYYVHEWVRIISLTVAVWLVVEAVAWAVGFCRRGMERVRRLNEREGKR